MATETNTSKKPLIISILALVAALASAAIALLDNDPETKPDIPSVIEAGTDVYDSATREEEGDEESNP